MSCDTWPYIKFLVIDSINELVQRGILGWFCQIDRDEALYKCAYKSQRAEFPTLFVSLYGNLSALFGNGCVPAGQKGRIPTFFTTVSSRYFIPKMCNTFLSLRRARTSHPRVKFPRTPSSAPLLLGAVRIPFSPGNGCVPIGQIPRILVLFATISSSRLPSRSEDCL